MRHVVLKGGVRPHSAVDLHGALGVALLIKDDSTLRGHLFISQDPTAAKSPRQPALLLNRIRST